MFCFFANTFFVEADAICDADDGIAVHTVFVAQVRAIEYIGYTIAVKKQIAVIVSAHDTLHIVLSQHIGYLIPVVHIAVAQWIVREDKDRCITRCRNAIQIMLEPCYVLWRYVSVCHANYWTRIETNKIHTIVREGKSAIAKHATKVHHTRLGPCCLVIARSGVIGYIQLV